MSDGMNLPDPHGNSVQEAPATEVEDAVFNNYAQDFEHTKCVAREMEVESKYS